MLLMIEKIQRSRRPRDGWTNSLRLVVLQLDYGKVRIHRHGRLRDPQRTRI